MKTSNKTLMKKVISMLLFVAIIATITGNAVACSVASSSKGQCQSCNLNVTPVASSLAGQSQSCNLTVTRDGVTYNLSQVQIAVVDGRGAIKQFQINDIKIIKDRNGKIKSVTVKMREVQKVCFSSTVDSIKVIDSSEYQNAKVVTTKNSANVNLNQVQLVTEQSNGVIKQSQVAVIKVKFTKNGIKVAIKMQQTQYAK
jgi:hypothetical protein